MASQYAKDQPAGFTNRIERVAIVGVSGQVGTYITKHLLRGGKHTITAITRADSTSNVPEGIHVAKVDYDNEQSLIDALQGQQFLIVSLAVTAPQGTEEKLIKAAAKAGVPWILPNSYTGDLRNTKFSHENLTSGKVLASIKTIEAAGVSSWVALVSNYWYEYSLAVPTNYGFDIAARKVEFIDDGNTKINSTTWDLSGLAVANLLSLKELPEDENDKSPALANWRNDCVFISSFLVSQRDMLDSLHRVLGTTDADWEIKHEDHLERFERSMREVQQGNMLAFARALYTRGLYPNGDGNYEAKYGLDNEKLGLPKEDLDEATKRAVELVNKGWNPYAGV